MALRGHVFNKQLFSSECFALFIDTFLDKNNGIITGCELSNTANSISIDDGYFCVRGRFLQEEGGTTINVEGTTQNDIYCKLVCEIDLSKENTVSELKQVEYKILQGNSSYPVLLQEDITAVGQGNVYQFEIAQFKITENGIEEFQDTRSFLEFNSIYTEIRKNINNYLVEQKITAKQQIDALILDLETYCNTAKEILKDDVALNLFNLIQTKSDIPRRKNVTLLSTNWTLNETTQKYEYRIDDTTITEDDDIDARVDNEEQEEAFANAEPRVRSYAGYYVFTTKEQMGVDILVQLVITRTKGENMEVIE